MCACVHGGLRCYCQVESKIDTIKEKFAKQMDRLKHKTGAISVERAECDAEATALAKVRVAGFLLRPALHVPVPCLFLCLHVVCASV